MNMKQRSFLYLTVGLVLLFTGQCVAQEMKAAANLINPNGENVGTVTFIQVDNGVKVNVALTGMEPGEHALHIHEYGKCDPPDFQSSGGHFNPNGTEHGFLNPNGPHAGDLPNITVTAEGICNAEFVTGLVTLEQGKDNSLLKEGGTSVMIHMHLDDYITDPAGQGGQRIACGVIQAQ